MGGMGFEPPGMPGGRGGLSLKNLKTFTSLENPVYRIFFGAIMGQMFAMNMQMMARTLLVYRITESAKWLGLLALVAAVPMLVFSLYGGVIADRVQKKFVLVAGDTASALVSLLTAIPLTIGYLTRENPGSWWILLACAFLQGTIMGLMMPSRSAIIREIVREDQLLNAVSLSMLGMNALRLLAPAASGFIIHLWDFHVAYYLMAAMYVVAAIFALLLPRTSTIAVRAGSAARGIKDGFRYIAGNATIVIILVFSLFAIVLSMPYSMLLPIFTEDVFNVGAAGMGIMMSVSGIGAILGSITLASLPNKKRGLLMLGSCLLLGLALVGFAFSERWALSLVLIAIVGLGQTGRMTMSSTLLQHYSTDEYRGRVMSLYMMEFGLTSLAVFGAALLADALGVQWAIGGFAMVLVAVSIVALLFLPRLRKLD